MNPLSRVVTAALLAGVSMIPAGAQQRTSATKAYNPLVPDNIADPSLVMFKDTFYLYATTDVDAGLAKGGTPVVWKSTDFIHWHFDGPLTLPGLDWDKPYAFTDAKGKEKTGYFRYWAPGKAVYKNGKYYLFPTIVTPDDKVGTYTVVADNPAGPFAFTNGTGIYFNQPDKAAEQTKPVADDIDGEPFVEEDGKAYLYWRRRFASALQDDLLTRQGDVVSIPTKLQGYSEGPGLFKRKGIYYYFYTLSGHASYCNGYMISRKSPLSAFEVPAGKNIFIRSDTATGIWGPGHGNVFQFPGTDEFIFLYLEYGEGGTTRQVFANRMQFNADGTIKPMQVDGKGVWWSRYKVRPRLNKAAKAVITASGYRKEKVVTTKIEADPEGGEGAFKGVKEISRTFTYTPANAADGSNGTRWWADTADKAPWIQFDLGKTQTVNSCEMYFVFPTYGNSWIMEKSVDGIHWTVCGTQPEQKVCSPHVVNAIGKARYIRIKITGGAAGLWECNIY
ncbi:F5/8 type C domain-containing protein [Filimonas lacunae]|uniref:F5/8 type C domain-containing protein n=1 Tax=Filimonas lacunae TaxID=477680 RepID=A0A173MPR6_9BACT|nr:family 43 glycosylhydrolase [Filimonas lacunae]BAV09457.1 beta-galactosidase [Filimonas lacunae]SIS73504.1 F5/8 type C domain-containing protein [Filimonas lacunae]